MSWPATSSAIALHGLHHALAKNAHFPGVTGTAASARLRALFPIGQILPALALAGAPLTSGALAKLYMKATTGSLPAQLPWLLSIAAVGTTCLMLRFLWSIQQMPQTADSHESPFRLLSSWAMPMIGVAMLPWLYAPVAVWEAIGPIFPGVRAA